MGRVTEFIPTVSEINKKYGPAGVTSFKSFKEADWVVHPIARKKIAAYTDDTVMSLIVLEESLKSNVPAILLPRIAHRFEELFGKGRYSIDPLYAIRAHGIQNQSNLHPVSLKLQDPAYDRKKDTSVTKEGGCGSVMRVYLMILKR